MKDWVAIGRRATAPRSEAARRRRRGKERATACPHGRIYQEGCCHGQKVLCTLDGTQRTYPLAHCADCQETVEEVV